MKHNNYLNVKSLGRGGEVYNIIDVMDKINGVQVYVPLLVS